jgi:hypothetical protein
MPKIPNWTSTSELTWRNDETDARLTVYDWENSNDETLWAFSVMEADSTEDLIPYDQEDFKTKSEAKDIARDWMKQNPYYGKEASAEMESHRSVESAKNDLVDVFKSTSEHHFEAVVTDGTYELYVIVEYNHSSDAATASIVSYEEDNGTLTHEISGSEAMHTAKKVVDEAGKIVGSSSHNRDWTFSDKLDERDGRYVWTKTVTGTEKVNA